MTDRRTGMSIRKKLLLSYFAVVVWILIVGIIGIYNIREVYSNGNKIYVNNLKSVECLKSMDQNVKEIDQCVISMMSGLNVDYHQGYIDRITKLQQENDRLMKEYADIEVTKLEQRRYNQCRLSILTFNKQIWSIVECVEAGDMESALGAYDQELMPAKACTNELLEAVVELSTKNADSKNKENHQIYQNIIWMISFTMLFAVILAIGITVWMSNYFTSKLEAIQRLAKRISEYNVSDDIQGMANDEFGKTMEALNDSQFMMRDLLEKIIDESTAISDTGEEVSLAVKKSNQRIEAVNVKVYDAGLKSEELGVIINEILENSTLDADILKQIRNITEKSAVTKKDLEEVQAELTSIAMYLEQIGITSDYQNEIANRHRDQVKKFKI